jgi:threonine aldolase
MFFDLRSDTVTRPTPAMLDAMMHAKVGDDVFGEDETVTALEQQTAAMFGMEAGLFCPSGTMTNQIAIKALSHPPGELICDETAHIYQYEGGGIAFNSGLSVNLIQGERGILSANAITERINPNDVHKAPTQLVCLENTSNRGGGSCYPTSTMQAISQACKQHRLPLHLDGARVFNAIVYSKQNPATYGSLFDTISVCLSKGLGAPVGSVLLGSKRTILRARRIRKLLGGGMRQAGYLAAAGHYAINNHVERLAQDHALAKSIEGLLTSISYVKSILEVQTNIVVFELDSAITPNRFLEVLNQHNIKAVQFGPQHIRFVTHLDVNEELLNPLEKALKSVG